MYKYHTKTVHFVMNGHFIHINLYISCKFNEVNSLFVKLFRYFFTIFTIHIYFIIHFRISSSVIFPDNLFNTFSSSGYFCNVSFLNNGAPWYGGNNPLSSFSTLSPYCSNSLSVEYASITLTSLIELHCNVISVPSFSHLKTYSYITFAFLYNRLHDQQILM